MGKVFTITEGLENMGALRTGGQGSVYKGRRIGEIITAIKLLPTPIHTESTDDKNYNDFKNEVEKLKRVNSDPNPHVVKILSSGITESGSFPFIEMEFIEGPDLEDLLKPPHDPVFTIKETIKVADQLSDALAHCHKVEVRHGDIKSNNVKFNINTGNYVLLDFGLAIMSDEQRRTSLRHAGAIEFMAPEQNEGQMFSQTDVYSFGVILFELLAGTVPFPLSDKGETARNQVRLSHMETPPPDILELRKQHLPDSWSDEKKQREMNVPGWLLNLVYKCLEKQPENRFEDGLKLHEYLVTNSTLAANKTELAGTELKTLQFENERLSTEKAQLEKQLSEYRQRAERQAEELALLSNIVTDKDAELNELKSGEVTSVREAAPSGGNNGVSKPVFYLLLVLTIFLAGFAVYTLLNKNKQSQVGSLVSGVDSSGAVQNDEALNKRKLDNENKGENMSASESDKEKEKNSPSLQDSLEQANQQNSGQEKGIAPDEQETTDSSATANDQPNTTADESTDQQTPKESKGYYSVISRAYFHDSPNTDTRRNAYIVHWNNAKLTPIDETGDFIYVVFKNNMGQTTKGWLRKSDLKWEEN